VPPIRAFGPVLLNGLPAAGSAGISGTAERQDPRDIEALMKYFFRSVKYLWPYKSRMAASLLCVLIISVLWAGSLSTIIPGAKILLSREGLHGWSDQTTVHSRLAGRTTRQELADLDRRKAWGGVAEVATVASVEDDGALAAAGIRPGQWILGVTEGSRTTYLEFDALHERLASQPAGEPWALAVYHPDNGEIIATEVAPSPASRSAKWLARAAGLAPRPRTWADRYGLLLWVLAVALVLNVIRDVFRFCQGYLVQTTVFRAIMDIRCELYDTTLRLPLSHFADEGASDPTSRLVVDTAGIARGLVALFGKSMVEPGKLIAAFAVALLLHWKLALLACVVGPPVFLLIRVLGKFMRRAAKRALQRRAEMLGALEETLGGIRVVKAYTMEDAERSRFRGIHRRLYKQIKRIAAADSATAPAVEAMGIAAATGAGALAGYWVFYHGLDKDVFLGLLAVLAAMFDPVRKLSQVATRFYAADAAAQRVFDLHDRQGETDAPGARDLPRHADSIEFRQVNFTYPNATRPALRKVDLTIRQGECLAIVGANGSGKTTLLSLLPRFFSPDAGQVLIDGADLAGVTLQSLRRQIGLVTQEAVIFRATVANNIAYGCRGATREVVEAAGRKAFVDEFVREMPDGYDTLIGERGSTLSGGQRQRIAIARAILRDPAILVFDEAMSQIDSESEAKIHQALQSFKAGRTTLLIAHRFSTVIGADRVAVMVDGAIVDVGSHADLLGRCEVYRTLFETQLIADEPPP